MRTPTKRRPLDLVLTAAATAGSICLVLTVAALIFGIRPLIVETGSMSPSIATGSLALAKAAPATDVHRGDVVTVDRPDGSRITHRVVSVDGVTGNSVTLTLQGDANDVPDAQKYVVTGVRRVVASVPYLGYVVSWLGNPFTIALQGLVLAFLLAVTFAPERGWRRSRGAHRLVVGTAAVTVVALGATTVGGSGQASAAPPPNVAIAVGTVNAGYAPSPASFTCAKDTGILDVLIGASVTFSWPNVPAPTSADKKFVFTVTAASGSNSTPIPSTDAAPSATITRKLTEGNLLSWLLGLLTGTNQAVITVSLSGMYYEFPSQDTLTHRVRYTSTGFGLLGLLPGFVCLDSAMRMQDAPTPSPEPVSESASPSEPRRASESTMPSTSHPQVEPSEPAPSTPIGGASTSATTTTPTLPPDGTPTASHAFAFYEDGSKVTIRDARTTDVVYKGSFASAATVKWLPGTEKLEVTEPDGTVTIVQQRDGNWVEDVTPPPAARTTPPVPQTTSKPAKTVAPETAEQTPTVAPTTEAAVPSA